jgi:endo-1,4-beta-xylanase
MRQVRRSHAAAAAGENNLDMAVSKPYPWSPDGVWRQLAGHGSGRIWSLNRIARDLMRQPRVAGDDHLLSERRFITGPARFGSGFGGHCTRVAWRGMQLSEDIASLSMKTKLMLRRTLFALLLLPATALAADQPREIPLWPNGAPGSEGKSGREVVRVTPDGEHVVSNVHNPSITPYLPPKDKATGAAVIVVPGGGHRELWVDHEGYNVARWLSARGIAAFVLKYRLAREPNSTYTVDEHALADTQRAIRLVRSRAQEWGIIASRIGVMGFSAGGELAALASMRFDGGARDAIDPVDRESSRPDFQALIYPGRSHSIVVTEGSPPAFLVCGYNDRPDISQGLAEVYLKFKAASVPAELHIYARAGHGFGIRDRDHSAVATWPARFNEWLADLGFLSKP